MNCIFSLNNNGCRVVIDNPLMFLLQICKHPLFHFALHEAFALPPTHRLFTPRHCSFWWAQKEFSSVGGSTECPAFINLLNSTNHYHQQLLSFHQKIYPILHVKVNDTWPCFSNRWTWPLALSFLFDIAFAFSLPFLQLCHVSWMWCWLCDWATSGQEEPPSVASVALAPA